MKHLIYYCIVNIANYLHNPTNFISCTIVTVSSYLSLEEPHHVLLHKLFHIISDTIHSLDRQ